MFPGDCRVVSQIFISWRHFSYFKAWLIWIIVIDYQFTDYQSFKAFFMFMLISRINLWMKQIWKLHFYNIISFEEFINSYLFICILVSNFKIFNRGTCDIHFETELVFTVLYFVPRKTIDTILVARFESIQYDCLQRIWKKSFIRLKSLADYFQYTIPFWLSFQNLKDPK